MAGWECVFVKPWGIYGTTEVKTAHVPTTQRGKSFSRIKDPHNPLLSC